MIRVIAEPAWRLVSPPLRVGVVGTGFVAGKRVAALRADPRVDTIALASYGQPERAIALAQTWNVTAVSDWQALIAQPLDWVIVATDSAAHGEVVAAALAAGKHVAVDYPLALDGAIAAQLLAQARSQRCLLHVEHIELLGGVHQSLRDHLPQVGTPTHARYSTIAPSHPAGHKWTYRTSRFGFPLVGALSRLHRLIDVLGPVLSVRATAQHWPDPADPTGDRFTACWCAAQLQFGDPATGALGPVGEVFYAKGDRFWRAERRLEIQGTTAALCYDHSTGTLTDATGTRSLPVAGKRGAFARDTAAVLDALVSGTPLYIDAAASVATLQVADAARRSAIAGGQPISLSAQTTANP